MNLRFASSRMSRRGFFGLYCQSKSLRSLRSVSPESAYLRSISRERRRSSSSCTRAENASMKSICCCATCSARVSSVAVIPERRSARSERSSSVIVIVIIISSGLWVSRRFIVKALRALEERVVFLDIADVWAGLLQLGRDRAVLGLGGAMLEDTLERVVSRLRQGEHVLRRVLDVLLRIAARQVR